MHVLMISLDGSLLGDPHGDTVERHLEYARRAGQMSIVVYNPAAPRRDPRQISEHLTVYPTNTRPYFFPWAAYRVAARIQRATPADMVTTQDPFSTGLVGLMLKWRFGLPLNVQSHSAFMKNADWLAEHPVRNRLLYALGKFVIRRADTRRVLTDEEKQHYMALGVPADRVFVLMTPTHVEIFAEPVPAETVTGLRARLNIPPESPVVLWVGYPVAFKNMDLLLDAFERVHAALPAARLVLVGDFSQRPDLVSRADPAAVHFAGHVAYDDLPAYYALADVYAHSSRYEGIPRVLLEALTAGTPVVATRNRGALAVVRDGETGLICDHTPDALAGAILDLLRDPARAQAMGAAGRTDILARFDFDKHIDAIVDSYHRTAGK